MQGMDPQSIQQGQSKGRLAYRHFVAEGLGRESIWKGMKGQIFLGGPNFVERFRDHLQTHKDIPDIARSQGYANRPAMGDIFAKGILRDKSKRNAKVQEAVERYAYTQREVADFLGLHFTSISRIMNQKIKR